MKKKLFTLTEDEVFELLGLVCKSIFDEDDKIQKYLKGNNFCKCDKRYDWIIESCNDAKYWLAMRNKMEKYLKDLLPKTPEEIKKERVSKMGKLFEKFFRDEKKI